MANFDPAEFSKFKAARAERLAPKSEVPSIFHQALAAGIPAMGVPETLKPIINSPMGLSALDFAAKEGPPIVGGMMGSAVGAPFGPAGMIGGAALGGAAGRGIQRDVEYLTGQRDPASDTAMGNANDMALSGLAQGGGEALGLGTTAAMASKPVQAVAKKGAGLAGKLVETLSGTPEKRTAAALLRPAKMAGAISPAERAAAYQAFEAKHGLVGLEGMMERDWQDMSPTQLKDLVLNSAKAISAKKPMSNQELYIASQVSRKLRDLAASGNPDAIQFLNGKLIGKANDLVNGALEAKIPEYGPLREKAFWSKTKDALSSVFPQKKNLSPNVLRTTTALGASGYEAKEGNLGAAALPLMAVSPAMTGLAIRGMAAAAPALPIAARAAAQSVADSNSQQPMAQASQPVVKSPALISMILRSNTLNPGKSGTWGREIEGMGLPSNMVSKSGKNSISQIASILHREGVIPEDDEGEAVQYLKSLAGKVK